MQASSMDLVDKDQMYKAIVDFNIHFVIMSPNMHSYANWACRLDSED